MSRSYLGYHRVLYKIIDRKSSKVLAEGFTSQKSACNWIKENGLKECSLAAYYKK